MLADYHVHTHYSDDSSYPMESVVRDAIKKNLEEICFTDHVDYGVKQDWDSGKKIQYRERQPLANVNYPLYTEEIRLLQAKYAGQIHIKLGMEFGMQVHTIPLYEQLFAKYPFDFIILSVHQVEDKEFWSQAFQYGRSQKEFNERYYQEMLALVKEYKNYSVLGHMDTIMQVNIPLNM